MATQLQQAQLPPFADTLLAQFKSHAKAHVDAATPQACCLSRLHQINFCMSTEISDHHGIDLVSDIEGVHRQPFMGLGARVSTTVLQPLTQGLARNLDMSAYIMQDRGEAPADLGYGRVLAGLQLISTLAAAQLFDALLTWRKASLKLTSTQQSDQITILRKRVS